MLRLDIPPVLGPTDAAPLSATIRGGRLTEAELQTALEHIHLSVQAVAQALRRSPRLEEEDLKLYGPNGDVVLRLTNTALLIRSAAGVEQQIVTQRQAGPSNLTLFPVSGTAGATYTGTEQTLINNAVAAINQLATFCQTIQTALKAHGLIT